MSNLDAAANKILDELEKGATYREIAKKYGVEISTVYRNTLRWGKPPGWKRNLNNDLREKEKVDISKELCVLPDLRAICKKRNISYFGLVANNGFRAKKIGCYKKARNICYICGVDITKRTWGRRLCKEHHMSERRRQLRLRIRRGHALKRRAHKYFTGVTK